MTSEEIILETLLYYYQNPEKRRALIGEDKECVYENDTGEMCAVGRCMIPQVRKKYINMPQVGVEELIIKNGVPHIDNLLLDQYKGYSLEFWSDLQALHDDQCFWSHSNADLLRKKHIESIIIRHGTKKILWPTNKLKYQKPYIC
jgi:hypothetical protein